MEEEDPVVQEMPVYLSQALAQNLYIYQYPVRPANRDWKDVKVTNASIKPKNQLVRMEIALDTYSDKYCPSKGEQIALNTDGQQESRYVKDKERERSQYFRNGIMDKIVYESSSPCVDTQHYAVALLQDKELHCTPIKGILQLRPSYSYYDKQDKRKADKNKAENSDEEEKEPEAQQVTVKFARLETDEAKKYREKSYESVSQRIANEPWYDALWKNEETDHAELERLKLFSATSSDGSALTLTAGDYVRALVPPSTDEAEAAPAKKLSLQDQIKEILINAKLMTFNELRGWVRGEEGAVADGALLAALGGAACCVRGLWAPRSQELYTRAAPVPPRLMCAARDHVVSSSYYINELRGWVRGEEGAVADGALLAALGGAACCVRGLWAPRSQELYTRAAPVPPRLMCAARDHVVSSSYYINELRGWVRGEEGAVADGALLAALGGAACCVRGLWAPRSQELYTRAAPVPPRLMCAARDHVVSSSYYINELRGWVRGEEGAVADGALLAALGGAACCVRGLWAPRSQELYTRAAPVPPRLMCAARDHVVSSSYYINELRGWVRGEEGAVADGALLAALGGAACCVRGLWAPRSQELYTRAAPVPPRLMCAARDHVVSSSYYINELRGWVRGEEGAVADGALLAALGGAACCVRGLWAPRSQELYTRAAPVPPRLMCAARDHVVSSSYYINELRGWVRGEEGAVADGALLAALGGAACCVRGLWAPRSQELYTRAAPVPPRLMCAARDHVVSSSYYINELRGWVRGEEGAVADGALLAALGGAACCVRGLWAPRSQELYTRAAPVPPRLMCAARDHVVSSSYYINELRGWVRGEEGAVADGALLAALGGAACCVRGLWAPRSQELYTRAAPVPPRLMCAARDHVVSSSYYINELRGWVRGEEGAVADGALLAALGGAACCVRGLWAPRSQELYTRAAPVPPRLMCAARDHVVSSSYYINELRGWVRGEEGAVADGALLAALGGAACCVRGLWAPRSQELYTRAAPVPPRLMCAARDHVVSSSYYINELRGWVRGEEGAVADGALLAALGGAACCVRGLWAPRSQELYTRAAPVPPRLMCAARDHVVSSSYYINELRGWVRGEEGAVADGALLAALGGAACCVRGLWAPRSQELYTRAAPVPPRLMCAARDHVLYLFTQHSYVDRRKIAAAVRLPPQEVLEILRSVSKYNPKTGWELLLPPDTAFEAKYPDVVQRQNHYWEARQRQFNEMLIGENVPKRQRKKSQRDSVSSDSMMSPKLRHNSVSEEDSDKKRHKNKSASGSGKRTRHVSSSSVTDAT